VRSRGEGGEVETGWNTEATHALKLFMSAACFIQSPSTLCYLPIFLLL
jgi:hypothetical protein